MADPIIRNEQERRQIQSIRSYLEKRGYKYVESRNISDFKTMKAGTFSYHLNVPVKKSEKKMVNMPIDVVIMRKTSKIGDMPVLIECKSAGDFTNTNKRRKEESDKINAYRLREGNTTRYSDDREPQGTAGMPTLDVLRQKDLVDCAVCVIRYFGGTLLGTGGLVHAYGTAAADAVKDAGIVKMESRRTFTLALSYSDHPRVQTLLSDGGAVVSDVSYAEGVTVTGTVPENAADTLARALTDATAGRVLPEWGETVFSPVPVRP